MKTWGRLIEPLLFWCFRSLTDLVLARANMRGHKGRLILEQCGSILQERWQPFKQQAIRGAHCSLFQVAAECETCSWMTSLLVFMQSPLPFGPGDLVGGNLSRSWQKRRSFFFFFSSSHSTSVWMGKLFHSNHNHAAIIYGNVWSGCIFTLKAAW